MRQRNASPYVLVLPTLDPPQEVAPGEEVDYPTLLAGCDLLDPPADPDTEPQPSDDTEGDVPVPSDATQGPGRKTTRKRSAVREDTAAPMTGDPR